MTSQPSELALRELLAVSIGTVSCYATLSPFLDDAKALADVLAEIGHSDLAAQLQAGCLATGKALQAIAELSVTKPTEAAQGDSLATMTQALAEQARLARYPEPGVQQARRHDGWQGPVPPAGGFSQGEQLQPDGSWQWRPQAMPGREGRD